MQILSQWSVLRRGSAIARFWGSWKQIGSSWRILKYIEIQYLLQIGFIGGLFFTQINRKYSVRWYNLRKSSFPFPWERYMKRNTGCICSWQHSRDFWILGKFLLGSISPEMTIKRRRDNSGMGFVPHTCGLWAISPPYECLNVTGMRLLSKEPCGLLPVWFYPPRSVKGLVL